MIPQRLKTGDKKGIIKIFHGVVVEKSLKQGVTCEDLFKVINVRENSSWGIKIVEVDEEKLDSKIKRLQECMDKGTWYEHFYNQDDTLVVVFKEKVFRISKSKDTWKEMIEYGKSLEIPEEQLNIFPLEFDDEEGYLNN